MSPNHPAYKLVHDENAFGQIQIIGNTVGWNNAGVNSTNFEGEEVFYPYDIDPIVLYNNSVPDKDREINIGNMIKNARKTMGITQDQLAARIGSTKHYISRIENGKSDIELLTLKKIIEAGLGKRLSIHIE